MPSRSRQSRSEARRFCTVTAVAFTTYFLGMWTSAGVPPTGLARGHGRYSGGSSFSADDMAQFWVLKVAISLDPTVRVADTALNSALSLFCQGGA